VSAPRRLLVVGGDAAGMSAASQARRRQDAQALEIIAFERGPDTSFSACGIPYWIGGLVAERQSLIARAPAEFREKQQIDVRTRSLVESIDTHERRVQVTDLETGRKYSERYDELLLGTGSIPVRPSIPGIDGDGVVGVHSLDDGARVISEVASGRVAEVVIIGAGYVGLEMADAMLTRGMAVTVLDRAERPMPTIDPDMGERVAAGLRESGVKLELGDGVREIVLDAQGRVTAVLTTAGRSLPADLVVLGLGVRPNVELARAAGIPLGPTGAIAVDRRMRSHVAGVWAAGDCVESMHVLSGRPVHIALGTHANKQGRVAGENIGGGYSTFAGVLGTAALKVLTTEVGRTGLATSEAQQAGFDVLAVTVDSTTRAGYYPDAKAIRVKIIAERGTGRMLGGQIVGHQESAKRIDILATAIWSGMTAQEFYSADLSYAPPYSPVLDPVVIAARKTHDAIRQDARGSGLLD
jgi:NADPH-dependent 2,4-dienoyl-CoA reductase/sulfur reductase-like enzyme